MVTGQSVSESDRFVDWFYELVGDVRETCDLSERQSAQVVQVIIERVQQQHGGQRVYVHRGSNAARILQRWQAGGDVTAISTELGVSSAYVRRVVSGSQKNERNLPVSSGINEGCGDHEYYLSRTSPSDSCG